MEFPGIGTIPYDAPPEEWREFIREKKRVWLRWALHSFIHSFIQIILWFIHSFIHSFKSFFGSFIHSFIQIILWFIHSFIYSFIHSFIL